MCFRFVPVGLWRGRGWDGPGSFIVRFVCWVIVGAFVLGFVGSLGAMFGRGSME